MNKYIIEALKDYNFEYDKNVGYGIIDGYEVNVINNPMATGPVFLFSTYLPQSKKNDFVMKMNTHKYSLVQSSYFEFGVCVVLGAMTSKGFIKKCQEVLPTILLILKELEAPTHEICPQSGEVLDLESSKLIPVLDSKVKVRVTNQAVETLNSIIEKGNEEYEAAPNNYLKGFLGILIGALAGVGLTVLFSYLGYITAFSSLVSIFLGTFLYAKFGGKQNVVMIIMSFVTTALAILLAVVLMYTYVASKALYDIDPTYQGFKALEWALTNSEEFARLFILDIILNVVFMFVGAGISLFRLLKMIKRPKTV